jgi:hypothetical protein
MTRLRIVEVSWSERPVKMRLPFQFGNTEVRETAEALCTLRIEAEGRQAEGRSAQLMVPRWFDKRPALSNADTIDELRRVTAAAVDAAPGLAGTALEITRSLRDAVAPGDVPRLAAGFGPSLVEMAVLDALCHALGLPFWKAAREDLFGLAAGCPADLSPDDVTRALAGIAPPRRLALRHTVGFDAPLRRDEVGQGAPEDGLPVSLEEVIARTGISAFKIKLKGDPEADHRRLRAIAEAIADARIEAVTLDANEQYAPGPFDDLLAALRGDAALAPLMGALRFVEQPFARETALSAPVEAPVPLVIDESDDSEDAFARALDLGWSGTSIKSCKGVLKALLNMARARAAGAILSGEDLTCQPGLCWQQDAAMMAACGVPDVERNGHHFAGGFQGVPEAERERLLAAHPGLYTRVNGRPALRIEAGQVDVSSLDAAGFGTA